MLGRFINFVDIKCYLFSKLIKLGLHNVKPFFLQLDCCFQICAHAAFRLFDRALYLFIELSELLSDDLVDLVSSHLVCADAPLIVQTSTLTKHLLSLA